MIKMTASDEIKKDLLRMELIAEKISSEKELFKRKFVSPKRGLDFVEKSSCVEKTGCTRSHEILKATFGQGFHENLTVH